MAISSAAAGTVTDMRRTTTTATTATGTDLASACTSVVAVADGVVTVATLAVTGDKPRGPAFCRPFVFRGYSGKTGEVHLTSAQPLGLATTTDVDTTPSHSASH